MIKKLVFGLGSCRFQKFEDRTVFRGPGHTEWNLSCDKAAIKRDEPDQYKSAAKAVIKHVAIIYGASNNGQMSSIKGYLIDLLYGIKVEADRKLGIGSDIGMIASELWFKFTPAKRSRTSIKINDLYLVEAVDILSDRPTMVHTIEHYVCVIREEGDLIRIWPNELTTNRFNIAPALAGSDVP